MLKYQIGTALIAGKARSVLYCQKTYFDLEAVMKLGVQRLRGSVSLPEPVAIPTSLMQVMKQWQLWQEWLPQIVELVLTQDVAATAHYRLDGSTLHWLLPLLYPNKLICIGTNYLRAISQRCYSCLPGGSIAFYPGKHARYN